MTNRRLATIDEAAEYTRISTQTLRKYISDGKLRAYRAGPRLVRIDLNDVDAMLRQIPTE